MIGALRALFEAPAGESEEQLQQRLHLVGAALLIETARADFVEDASERAALEELLCSSLQLDRTRVRELLELASRKVDEATSLYEFTRLINDHYSAAQKLRLIDAMWSVACADGAIDKYEEHLIRRVAELTYVPHSDYIRSKLTATAQQSQGH
ncbi:MAG: TerB family tellurite resistance protein [Halioglobus sp.]|nr:TerB family tellurite resistance protein [Halioglobus sp.]